jgi:hypothetical protein
MSRRWVFRLSILFSFLQACIGVTFIHKKSIINHLYITANILIIFTYIWYDNTHKMQAKLLIITYLLFVSSICFSNNGTTHLLGILDQEITKRDTYLENKKERIAFLTRNFESIKESSDTNLRFEYCMKLIKEYESFSYDSAFKYVTVLNEIAFQTRNTNFKVLAELKKGFTLLSSGLFKESLDILNRINLEHTSDTIKHQYYNIIARTYFDLADYNNEDNYANTYRSIGTHYLDSALVLLDQKSSIYWSTVGLRRMKSNDIQGAADAFNFLLSKYDLNDHTYAIATSSLGYLYTLLNRTDDAIDMLIKASIADIHSSTKETVALRNLSVQLFNKGDLKRAYRYIKIALDDATHYNARHRKIEVGAVLPIIEGERLATVERQKKQLLNYSFILSMLSILVLSFFSIIYLQYKRLVKIRLALQVTNNILNALNQQLEEANKIKQEYIGYFFNVNSEYIDKMEAFQKKLHRKVLSKQYNDLDNLINSTDLKKERQQLFDNFDRIFLKIFPNFIEEFNKMLIENERIYPDKDELLNTDLRIYALIRLGITDNDKIAKFLNYSVNTIYTYKTKIKNKTNIHRDEFEKRVMDIRSY